MMAGLGSVKLNDDDFASLNLGANNVRI